MKLPDKSAKNILGALTSKSLLEESVSKELVEALEKQKDVNWNLVLTKQFESEQGGHDEAES
jgi:hypothetical protein